MIERLLKSGGSELIAQLGAKFGLDNSVAQKVTDVSAQTLQDGFLSEITAGNFDGILSLVNGKSSSAANALNGSLTDSLVSGLLNKVGLKNDMAVKIAQMVIPYVLKLIKGQKTSGDFDASDLTGMFKGAAGDMLKDKASNLLKGGLDGLFN